MGTVGGWQRSGFTQLPSHRATRLLRDGLFFLPALQSLNLNHVGGRLLEHVLPVETRHLLVIAGILLLRLRALLELFLSRVLGDALLVEIGLRALRHGLG